MAHDLVGDADLPVELEGAGMDDDRTGFAARTRVLVDDADRHALTCQEQCQGKAGRPGACDENLMLRHGAFS